MSMAELKPPSRPPPPPPIYTSHRPSHSFTNTGHHHHHHLHHHHHPQQQSSLRKSHNDYIKISECTSGPPKLSPSDFGSGSGSRWNYQTQGHHHKTHSGVFKSRTSTSFSSTLKPSNFSHSNHQKSRSLTNNHIDSSYLDLDLDLPKSLGGNLTHSGSSSKHESPNSTSIIYNCVDFLKTDALTKCKVERTSGKFNNGF